MSVTEEEIQRKFEDLKKYLNEKFNTTEKKIEHIQKKSQETQKEQERIEVQLTKGMEALKEAVDKKIDDLQQLQTNKFTMVNDKIERSINLVQEDGKSNDPVLIPIRNELHGDNIEITMPKFYGNNRDIHPKEFLANLDEFFIHKKKNRNNRMLYVRESLQSNAANWYSMIKQSITTYEEFEEMFLDEFWSRELQLHLWGQFMAADRVKDISSYTEYFCNWYQKIKHQDVPKLTTEEIITSIAKHFPGYIQSMLVSLTEKTYRNAINILKAEDNRPTHNLKAHQSNPFYRNDNRNNKNNNSTQQDVRGATHTKPAYHERNVPIKQMIMDHSEEQNIDDHDDENNGPKNFVAGH